MLRLVNVEKLQDQLREIPEIVDSQQQRLSVFPERVCQWLQHSEAQLEQAHLASVSDLAALRSRLLLAIHNNDSLNTPGHNSRKHRIAVASSVLQEAQKIINQSIATRLEQINEAEAIALKIISVARAKGVIDKAKQLKDHQSALQYIQSAMTADSDTAAAMVHLSGLLGMIDILVVLDRAIPDL